MARNRRRQRPANGRPKFNVHFYDRGRPNAPYVLGSRWTLQAHAPPPPFGEGYRVPHRRGPAALAAMRSQQLPQSTYCLLNPPPGPEPPTDAPRLTVEVVEELRVHAGRGAQVVACRVVDGTPPPPGIAADTVFVAKLYDPLYYYYNGEHDILELADMEYCREAAAYAHLQREGVDGQLLPAYFGAYTTDVPLTPEQREILAGCRPPEQNDTTAATATARRVRLTLMAKVEGEAMTYQLVFGDVRALPDTVRLRAVATAMEAYAQLYWHGLVHGDLAPRNVFLREAGPRAEPAELYRRQQQLVFSRFVDLGLAYVLGSAALQSACPRQPARERRPRSPIRLFWNVLDSGAANMYHWLPDGLRNTHAFQGWMLQRWYGDPRYEPIGPEPRPSADKTPWDTGKAAKVQSWPADEDDGAVQNVQDDGGAGATAGTAATASGHGDGSGSGNGDGSGSGSGGGSGQYAATEVEGFW